MESIPLDIFGLPTIEGNMALGSSSPAIPALHIPEPLSITTAGDVNSSIAKKVIVIEIINYYRLNYKLILSFLKERGVKQIIQKLGTM